MPICSEGRALPEASSADRRIQISSKGHCTAHTVLKTGPAPARRFQAESYLELCHLMIQNARADVVDLREQVLFTFGPKNTLRHFFDMVVTLRCGERIAYTVKPEVRLTSGRFLDEMVVIAYWVERKGFAASFRLLTEADLDPVDMHNAQLLAGLQDGDAEAMTVAREVGRRIQGAVPLNDLTVRTGLKERGYRALLSLLSTGDLQPVRRERIRPNTLVHWKGTRQ